MEIGGRSIEVSAAKVSFRFGREQVALFGLVECVVQGF